MVIQYIQILNIAQHTYRILDIRALTAIHSETGLFYQSVKVDQAGRNKQGIMSNKGIRYTRQNSPRRIIKTILFVISMYPVVLSFSSLSQMDDRTFSNIGNASTTDTPIK